MLLFALQANISIFTFYFIFNLLTYRRRQKKRTNTKMMTEFNFFLPVKIFFFFREEAEYHT